MLIFETHDDQNLTQVLAKYLHDNQLLLNSYRELARQTDVAFSFVNETPGTELTSVSLLVVVDIPDNAQLDRENSQAIFVNLDGLLSKFSTSPAMGPLSHLGVAQLKAEANTLGHV